MTPQRQWHATASLAALGFALACTPSSSAVGPTSGAVIRAVLVTPDSMTVGLRTTPSFTAVAQGASGVVGGVSFVWSSSNPSVATVDQKGRVTLVDTGQAEISASAQGVSALATLIVTPATVGSIVVTPPSDTLLFANLLQLSDTVKDRHGDTLTRSVTWASSNPRVATVSNSGLVTAQGPGIDTISASTGGKSGISTIIVPDTTPASISLQVSPDSVVVIPNPLDALIQLTATVRNASGRVLTNYPVVFTTSNSVVTGTLGAAPVTVVGGSILVLPNGNGTAVITAVAGSFNAQASLTVCYAATSPICSPLAGVQLTPAVDTVAAGDSVVMNAIGVDSLGNTYPGMFVEWDPGTVMSSGASPVIAVAPWGTVYALNPGTQYVEGEIQGFGAQAQITVTPAAPTTSIASTVVRPMQSSVLLGALATATARERAARASQQQTMQQVVLDRMRLTRSPSLKAYYAQLAARLGTPQDHVAQSVTTR